MCFVLYSASRSKPTLIPFDEKKPALNSQQLSATERAVAAHFTLPIHTYIGADSACGCNFRHLLIDDPRSEQDLAEDTILQPINQPNHLALAAYLSEQFAHEPFIELHGCWSGDEADPPLHHFEIPLSKITDPTFAFRERAFYRVQVKS